MALTVIGGSNFLGRYIIKSLSAQYPEIRLGDMYPYRDSVYKLQEQLDGKLKKFALSYPSSLKYAIDGASRIIIVDHDYYKLSLSKNFYLEKTVEFASEFGIKDITWVHPQEFTHLGGLEGNPYSLISKTETQARKIHPELKSLKTNLIFGPNCTSHIILKTLEDLSNNRRIITGNNGSVEFAPVYDAEVLQALNGLKDGESVVIGGPEKMTWENIVGLLAENMGVGKPSHTNLVDKVVNWFASGNLAEIFYPSQLQQLHRLIRRHRSVEPTVTGKVKLGEFFKPNDPQPVAPLNWHRIALD